MTYEVEIAQLNKRFSEVVEKLSKAEARKSQLLAHVSTLQTENQPLQEQLVWRSIVLRN